MWIERLDVAGFKQLRGAFTFGPGLTLVHGPNEAGKSALQEAALRALFGFTTSERRMRNGVSALTRTQPWAGGAHGVSAVVRDARDGRSLRITWNFADHAVTVHDGDTGEDFSAEVRGQRQDVRLGRWLLGLELDDYRQACCLFQVAVEPVVHSDGLVGALRAAVEQGASGGGVTAADELLKAFLGTRLGLHGRWYTPLATGERTRIDHELAGAIVALEAAEATREEIRELSVDQAELDEQLALARREQQVIEQRMRLTECGVLRQRGEEVERQRARLARRPEQPVALPASEHGQVAALRRQIESNRQRVLELEDEVAGAAERVAELEAQRRERTLARDRLDAYAEWDTSAEVRVRALHGQLSGFDQEPDGCEEPGARDPDVSRYRAERERLRELAHAQPALSWRRDRLVVAFALAVLSAAGAAISPLALVGLVLAALVALAARPSATGTETDALASALHAYGVDSVDELELRAAGEERAVAAAEGRREERQRQSHARGQARSRLERQLREALTSAGVVGDGPLDDAVRAYLTGCERHAARESHAARLDGLDAELLRAREPHRDLDTRRHELAQNEAELLAAYARAGANAPNLKEAETTYASLAARAQADEELLREAREAEEALRVALAGQTPQQFEAALADAETRLREHVALHGELTIDQGERPELDQRLAELHRRIEAGGGEAAALTARIEEREAAAGDPAALQERIAFLGDRQRRFQRAADAIRLARDGLAEAARQAHRAFAPHLNAALARDLPRVTGGRYARATVGDELDIKVIAPETDALVAIDVLSRGTQDQIALVERLAIARMLDPTTGHAPLLLDDPFGRTDPHRRRQALELISELAAERQIIIATEDPALVELAAQVYGEVVRIDLAAPSAPRRRDVTEPAPVAGAPPHMSDAEAS